MKHYLVYAMFVLSALAILGAAACGVLIAFRGYGGAYYLGCLGFLGIPVAVLAYAWDRKHPE